MGFRMLSKTGLAECFFFGGELFLTIPSASTKFAWMATMLSPQAKTCQ